jgi:D-xylose transport system substrate-binding protein
LAGIARILLVAAVLAATAAGSGNAKSASKSNSSGGTATGSNSSIRIGILLPESKASGHAGLRKPPDLSPHR